MHRRHAHACSFSQDATESPCLLAVDARRCSNLDTCTVDQAEFYRLNRSCRLDAPQRMHPSAPQRMHPSDSDFGDCVLHDASVNQND